MVIYIDDYLNPQAFAELRTKQGEAITRNGILYLIRKEKEKPGSTGLDVLVINGYYFVRQSPPQAPQGDTAAAILQDILKEDPGTTATPGSDGSAKLK